MKVAVVGCGNMGLAYAKSLAQSKEKVELLLVEPSAEKRTEIEALGIGEVVAGIDERVSQVDYVVTAVKPQAFAEVGQQLGKVMENSQVIVSIMAGVTSSVIAKITGAEKIVRAMPNTPCQLGIGVTGYYVAGDMSESENEDILTILSSTGKLAKVDSEADVDSVTAVSGSGPAYFYFFVKSMIEAGEKFGLSHDTASLLTKQTMLGAYELLKDEDDLDKLIAAVKSKGGTTEAALNHFSEQQLDQIVASGLEKAKIRAAQLSQMLEK